MAVDYLFVFYECVIERRLRGKRRFCMHPRQARRAKAQPLFFFAVSDLDSSSSFAQPDRVAPDQRLAIKKCLIRVIDD